MTANDGDYHESAKSNQVTETAATLPPPPQPTGLTATYDASTTAITLSWTAPSNDIVGYSIYRCEGPPCTPEWTAWVANTGDAPPAPTEYIDTDVTSGAAYRYAVTSNNAAYFESAWSDVVTVQPPTFTMNSYSFNLAEKSRQRLANLRRGSLCKRSGRGQRCADLCPDRRQSLVPTMRYQGFSISSQPVPRGYDDDGRGAHHLPGERGELRVIYFRSGVLHVVADSHGCGRRHSHCYRDDQHYGHARAGREPAARVSEGQLYVQPGGESRQRLANLRRGVSMQTIRTGTTLR